MNVNKQWSRSAKFPRPPVGPASHVPPHKYSQVTGSGRQQPWRLYPRGPGELSSCRGLATVEASGPAADCCCCVDGGQQANVTPARRAGAIRTQTSITRVLGGPRHGAELPHVFPAAKIMPAALKLCGPRLTYHQPGTQHPNTGTH